MLKKHDHHHQKRKHSSEEKVDPEELEHFGGHIHDDPNAEYHQKGFHGEFASDIKEVAYKKTIGKDGKENIMKYVGEKHEVGNKDGLVVEEMTEVFGDSETGVKMRAEERMIGNVGKRIVVSKDQEGKFIQLIKILGLHRHVYYKGEGADEPEFDEKWNQAAKAVGYDPATHTHKQITHN